MIRPIAILAFCVLGATLALPAAALAHAGASASFRARIVGVSPDLPVDIRVLGDRMQVDNRGDETMTICNDDDGPCRGREIGPGDDILVLDERLHWVGGADTVPPGVDEGDPTAQKVLDIRIPFEYGDRSGTIKARLDYIGGRSWLNRYGEYSLLLTAVVVMVGVFVVDSRRRRRATGGTQPVEDDEA